MRTTLVSLFLIVASSGPALARAADEEGKLRTSDKLRTVGPNDVQTGDPTEKRANAPTQKEQSVDEDMVRERAEKQMRRYQPAITQCLVDVKKKNPKAAGTVPLVVSVRE